MRKMISMTVTLVIALSLCIPVCAGAEVQKYGDIGRLSKLNISEDELNDVLKDIMVNGAISLYWRPIRIPYGISFPGMTA